MAQATLYTPHQNQRKIHDAINNGPEKYYILAIGRQFGKTLLGINQMLFWALNYRKVKIGWVSPIYAQCKKVFKETNKAFEKKPHIYRNVNKGDLILEYVTGSTVQFFSADNYDSIRGNTFDFLVIDEADFIAREAWTEVLRATVLVHGKKVLIMSTPKGRGLLWELFNLPSTNDKYKSFTMTSYDNPHIDPKEIDDAKATLPDHIFRQEYLAEFLDDGGSVFRNIKDCIRTGVQTPRLFFGVDLGRANDFTVLTIVNDKNEEIFCKRWRHMDWSVIVREIVEVLNRYKPVGFVEANGAQDAIYEMIRDKVTYGKDKIHAFVTGTKNKQTIIEDLIVCFEEKSLGIIGEDFQVQELEVFTYEYNLKSRQIKYSAPTGLHDDYVMSRAIANHALKELKSSGKYHVY